MTYAKNSKVEASDYNAFVTSVNKLYATGLNISGLGQTSPALTPVTVGNTVDNSEWDTLGTIVNKIATHQGTSITTIPAFNEGNVITYLASVSSGITSIINNNRNAGAQGTTIPTVTTYSSTWSNILTFTHVVTFASADQARYFFNAGGQIAMTFGKSGSAQMDVVWQTLVNKIGTLYISAGGPVGTETSKILGTTYRGFQQVSSSPSAASGRAIYNQSYGYYYLSKTSSTLYQQYSLASTAAYSYNQSNIKIDVKTNGPQGSNGDNGSVITITTVWDELPNGLVASAGTTVTVSVRPPSTAQISNTWGTVSIVGSVSGS